MSLDMEMWAEEQSEKAALSRKFGDVTNGQAGSDDTNTQETAPRTAGRTIQPAYSDLAHGK